MFWIWFFICLGAAAVIGSVVLFFVGRTLRYRNYTLSVRNLPPAFDGFRIAVISDLHDRRFGKGNRRLIKKVLGAAPDLAVMAGDMHENPHPPQPFYNLVSGISAQVPLTYTEGNHDLRHVSSPDYGKHVERIRACGAFVLNDDAFPVERNGALLMLYGISWKSSKEGRAPDFDPFCPAVVVCHDPLVFDRLDPLPDLTVSGHVHGGILRLPGIGPVFAPGDGAPLSKRFARRFFFPKYSRGLYFKGDRALAVTQGLGFSILPIRFIPPEVMILTLKQVRK